MPLYINDSNIKIKSINKTLLRKTLIRTMTYLNIEKKHIDITFIGNSKMKSLNLEYKKVNKSTDVLSFLIAGHDKALLGEIFICLDYARKNCLKNKNSLAKEVKILCIHGVLHLLGYDHAEVDDEISMFQLQDDLYNRFR
jgi:probable rRNA maturation factor|tara:strand:- start:332 stop:751 length:420 start_codon:yes stop_codon:yes gene_type:complete